jgi:general secretion pathway protein K
MRSLHRRRQRQRGVAVVTALLLTTLAITIVASLFWQQQVQVRSIENQRLQLQKQWILRGALDWACVILRANAGKQNDNLDDPWAVPLEETRLDQYVENGRTDADSSDATLSGNTIDAQGMFNLGNLFKNDSIASEVEMFRNLLSVLQLPPSLADATVKVMKAAVKPSVDAPDAPRPLNIRNVDDLLAVPGFTPEIVDKLRKFVIVLPDDGAITKINVNTASAEVLAARVGTLTLSDANALVASRKQAYFRDIEQFLGRMTTVQLPESEKQLLKQLMDVKTNYFIVNGHVRLSRAGLSVRALIRRDQNAARVVWVRED